MALTNGSFPDISIDRARSDYEFLFKTNARTIIKLRSDNTEAGNYGADDEVSVPNRIPTQLNIMGISSDFAERAKFGLSVAGSIYHAYALYTEDILVTDFFEFNGTKFKVMNLNKANKNSLPTQTFTEVVFQEFDLVQISTSSNYSI